MLSFLLGCINRFGWLSGFNIWVRVKLLKLHSFQIPELETPLHLRQTSADIHTFREIFLREEYAIKLDFIPQIIVDAGANIGFTTLFFHKRYPNAQIYCLEPDTANFSMLRKNTGKCFNIYPIQKALFNKEGTIELLDEGYGERGYMVKDSGTNGVNTLPCTTIPTLLKVHNLSRIDILKMDIEGSELEVFEHEPATWLPLVRILIIEIHDRMKPGCSKSVFSTLSAFHFSMAIKGENLVFTNLRPI